MLKFIKEEEGVAATEFALIVPVIVLILIGMIDFAMYINAQMKLENAARAAAEYVYMSGNIDSIQEDVMAYTEFSQGDSGLLGNVQMESRFVCECTGGVSTLCSSGCGKNEYMRKFIEVRLLMEHETIFPYPGLPDVVDLVGSVRYQVQ